MITSKKELTVLSTKNQVFAVLVAHFDSYEWRSNTERNQITVRVMNIFYPELDMGSESSILIGKNTR